VLRVSDDQVQAAIEHAESCPACREFLEEDRRVAEFIRDAVPRVCAPRELRERLYTALARERADAVPTRPRMRRKREMLAAAAVIAAVAVASGYWLASRNQPATAATAFAEDYLRRVVEQEELNSSDRTEIAAFFARELGVAMPPPEVPGLEIQRATICLMNGRRGGVVEYTGVDKQLTYYLLPGDEGSKTEPRSFASLQETSASNTAPALAEERGLGVATWWDDEHQHAWLGSLPERELKRLAPLFACPAKRSLAGP
jgi:anti-sigma factor RsiW